MGLAGCCGLADWFIRWREVARRLRGTAPVAVVYADWKTCGSPPPEQILAAARKLGCPALLCDTHDKQSGGLFDHLDRDTILSLSEAVRCAGMMFALAGSLELRHLDLLMQCRPDYVAVRGAACAGNRLGTIQRDKVRATCGSVVGDVLPVAPDCGWDLAVASVRTTRDALRTLLDAGCDARNRKVEMRAPPDMSLPRTTQYQSHQLGFVKAKSFDVPSWICDSITSRVLARKRVAWRALKTT